MLIKFISYVPALVGMFVVALVVLLSNPGNIRNRLFAIFNCSIIFWLLFLFIADTTKSETSALWSLRLALFFGAIVFLTFYYFTLVFPFQKNINIRKQALLSLPLIVIAILSFTPYVVPSVSIQEHGAQPENTGYIYAFSDFISMVYLFAGIFALILKYKKSDKYQKLQIRFMLYGLVFAIVVNLFTGVILTLLKVKTDLILLGSVSLFIFSLFVAYSIVKHKFFDVKLIVARSLGYGLTIITIGFIYGFVAFSVVDKLFFKDEVLSTTQEVVNTVLAIVLVFTFQPIQKFFNRITNKLFYRDAYDPQVFLDQLNQVLVSNIELDVLLRESARIVETNLKSEFCLFDINATETTNTHIIGSINSTGSENAVHEIAKVLSKSSEKTIVADDLEETDHRRLMLRKYNYAVVVRLSSKQGNGRIGYLILGDKQSGNPYNSQDMRMIEIVANELVIAIQNSLRFEEIQTFNITLQAKVDEATKQLRKTNDKLKELDETKDEFISMASHQLRTPLTSMKGYVSMVLDGDSGRITAKQRQLLEQAFASSQRMVYLIADLLNVSRLRTGKFVIENKPTQLIDVVGSEMDQLILAAKAKNLDLIFKKPKDLPLLNLDETKIRQVIMNFIDNALYYTPAGGHITIELIDKASSVEFRVVDDGLGVPKPEQHHLFTKFYRAGNARKARPDGTGLGLFMAKKVIVAQGGAIVFSSQEGKGSTFGFTLPKAKHTVVAKQVKN